MGVCTLYKVKGGVKKQEERTDEELLMALLLSLSADCDSQNQLLSKTTSPRKRRKCSQEVTGAREGDQGRVMEKTMDQRGKPMEGDGWIRMWAEQEEKMEGGRKNKAQRGRKQHSAA